ncbi:thiosulfate sulfurtransferase GlpE [Simiduia sp. 21SJ11W-1]|uniref:thiosulfate sulfurtransferase GlpE n=1 Tax=Simiduia sp. 21SJ11W-1 TaxID=2909669 RepID=UPI00209F3973|nr:thiosulfate sulfurtransferase GlpE [Simiduia sp. 21SJ11W-1]UTA47288.1 thiosulfate sulfurtransferase GlpE [Simiduia sp. 21SJ11W-1]
MAQFQRISTAQAKTLCSTGGALVVDIRDPQSFAANHIKDAQPLSNENLADFMANTDKSTQVVVCCYHGNSSQSAALYLAEQGFNAVYSLDGGFEQWRLDFPEDCSN